MAVQGIPVTQMDSIVHRIHLGRLLCPKPSLFNDFQGISDFQENWGSPLGPSLCISLFPFVDPYSLGEITLAQNTS